MKYITHPLYLLPSSVVVIITIIIIVRLIIIIPTIIFAPSRLVKVYYSEDPELMGSELLSNEEKRGTA